MPTRFSSSPDALRLITCENGSTTATCGSSVLNQAFLSLPNGHFSLSNSAIVQAYRPPICEVAYETHQLFHAISWFISRDATPYVVVASFLCYHLSFLLLLWLLQEILYINMVSSTSTLK